MSPQAVEQLNAIQFSVYRIHTSGQSLVPHNSYGSEGILSLGLKPITG